MLESVENKVLQNDFDSLANSNTPFNKLAGKTVLVTGATGLIGSQFIKSIACYNRVNNTNIKVVAFVRSEEKAKKVFGEIPNIEILVGDINSKIEYSGNVDLSGAVAAWTADKGT